MPGARPNIGRRGDLARPDIGRRGDPPTALKCGAEQQPRNAMPALPRILHQTAPADVGTWPDAWLLCQNSWNRLYRNWTRMFWDDDAIDALVAEAYPEELGWFRALPVKIARVDAARSFILHRFGGVYADMDMYAHARLRLPEGDVGPGGYCAVVGSAAPGERVQNSLMASTAGHPFWVATMRRMREFAEAHPGFGKESVLAATGPEMLRRTLEAEPGLGVRVLPATTHNPPPDAACRAPGACVTKHLLTGCWGIDGERCAGHDRGRVPEMRVAPADVRRGCASAPAGEPGQACAAATTAFTAPATAPTAPVALCGVVAALLLVVVGLAAWRVAAGRR